MKERAREHLARKYRSRQLSDEEILHCIYSISDNNSYLLFNRDPVDRWVWVVGASRQSLSSQLLPRQCKHSAAAHCSAVFGLRAETNQPGGLKLCPPALTAPAGREPGGAPDAQPRAAVQLRTAVTHPVARDQPRGECRAAACTWGQWGRRWQSGSLLPRACPQLA